MARVDLGVEPEQRLDAGGAGPGPQQLRPPALDLTILGQAGRPEPQRDGPAPVLPDHLDELLEDLERRRFRRPVRETLAALVIHDQPGERGEPAEVAVGARCLEKDLEVRHEAGYAEQVQRAIAQHGVRDAHAVGRLRIADLRRFHDAPKIVPGLGPAVRLRLVSGSQWPPSLRRSRIWSQPATRPWPRPRGTRRAGALKRRLAARSRSRRGRVSHGRLHGSVTRTRPSRRASGRSVRTVPRVTSVALFGWRGGWQTTPCTSAGTTPSQRVGLCGVVRFSPGTHPAPSTAGCWSSRPTTRWRSTRTRKRPPARVGRRPRSAPRAA